MAKFQPTMPGSPYVPVTEIDFTNPGVQVFGYTPPQIWQPAGPNPVKPAPNIYRDMPSMQTIVSKAPKQR